MGVFKPTRGKIILAILISVLWYGGVWFNQFLSCPTTDLYTLKLPSFDATPTPIPNDLQLLARTAVSSIGLLVLPSLACVGDPLNLSGKIVVVLLLMLSYLLSCTIVFLVYKLKKQNTHQKT